MVQITEVPNGTGANLVVSIKKSGRYVCRVGDKHFKCVFSDWIKVDILDSPATGMAHKFTNINEFMSIKRPAFMDNISMCARQCKSHTFVFAFNSPLILCIFFLLKGSP